MFRVVYTSRLAPDLGSAEIASIVHASQARNARDGVTCAWLMRERDCLSALEGPPLAVRNTVERIWDDRRNTDFRIAFMTTSEHRLFEGWPIKFIEVDEDARDMLTGHEGLNWLCGFAGGADAFIASGLEGGAGDNGAAPKD